MPALQIREMPDATYKQLKERAAHDNRSMSQEALTFIQRCLCYSDDNGQPGSDGFSRDIAEERRIEALLYEKKLEERKVREERVEKRRALFEKIRNSDKSWIDPNAPSAAEIIRAMREERCAW